MEELNQVQETTDDGLFDDEELLEEIDDSKDETEETNDLNQDNPDEEHTSTSPFLKIRYNKEDLDLSQEQAIELAQKGMNYDKLTERYTNQSKTLNDIEQLAMANGMSLEEFVSNLGNIQVNILAKQELEQLKGKYPNADEELLKEMANSRAKEKLNLQKLNQAKSNLEKQDSQKQALNQQLQRFEKRYPNIDASKLDAEVYELMQDGYTLLEAYEEVQTIKNQQTKQIEEKNQANKSKSLGSTSNVETKIKDDFLSGFLD